MSASEAETIWMSRMAMNMPKTMAKKAMTSRVVTWRSPGMAEEAAGFGGTGTELAVVVAITASYTHRRGGGVEHGLKKTPAAGGS